MAVGWCVLTCLPAQLFPLSEEHWVNQPVEEENSLLLLQLAVRQEDPAFTQLLVSRRDCTDNSNRNNTGFYPTGLLAGLVYNL